MNRKISDASNSLSILNEDLIVQELWANKIHSGWDVGLLSFQMSLFRTVHADCPTDQSFQTETQTAAFFPNVVLPLKTFECCVP